MKCSAGISNFLEISAAAAKLLSHVQLLATPWTAAYQAPPSMGFSRQDYWSGVPLLSPLRTLVFPILLFSSISLHWSLRRAFLSLLAILWNSTFRCIYLYFSPLPFTSFLFSAIWKASSDNHFAFLHFFFLGMALITASCIMSWMSIHSSSGTLSIRSKPWIYLSFPLYNHKGFDLGHTWMA